MDGKQSYLLAYILLMFLLLVKNQATTIEAQKPQQSSTLSTHGIYQGSLKPEECPGHCSIRCSKTSHKKPCLFFCKKCCAKCLCVPPGTYGNKHFCPCYDNWKTKRGGPKCP